MGDFFKPWRRKIGCVTLLMACLFMAGWVRSISDTDFVHFYCGNNSTALVLSSDRSVVWTKFHEERSHDEMSFPEWDTTRKKVCFDERFEWKWQWGGFSVGHCHSESSTVWVIPYWSITIPLMLLSAYLLPSKPRISNQKKLAELTENEGGA